MARTCTVCAHPRREHIDARLIEGESCTLLAARHGLSHDAVRRHRDAHLAPELVHWRAAAGRGEVASLFLQAYTVQIKTLHILENAVRMQDRRTALAAIREARRNVEMLSRLRVRSWDCARQDEMAAAERAAAAPAGVAEVHSERRADEELNDIPELDECLVVAALTEKGDRSGLRAVLRGA